jgi:tight adherence protein B
MDESVAKVVFYVSVFFAACALFFLFYRMVVIWNRAVQARLQHKVERDLSQRLSPFLSQTLLTIVSVLVISFALGVWLISSSLWAAACAALVAGLVPRALLNRARRRRLLLLREQFPQFLSLLAGSLRSGSGLTLAMTRAALSSPVPLRHEIERTLGDLRLGNSLSDAVSALERRVSIEDITLFATALRVGLDTGGSIANALESLGDTLRRKLAIESKVRALTAQGRVQAWVMALLPALILALLAVVDSPSFAELVFTETGRVVLLAVAVAQVAGFRLVKRIVSIEV